MYDGYNIRKKKHGAIQVGSKGSRWVVRTVSKYLPMRQGEGSF